MNLDDQRIYIADKIEHTISYVFKCNVTNCPSHNITCEDWELLEPIRSWNYPPSEKQDKIKNKFFNWMIEKRDLYFYMGMHSIFPSWLIIGLFYPPL